MLGLNTFRSTVLLLVGIVAYLYLSPDTSILRQRAVRAPLPSTDRVIFPALAEQLARGGTYDIQFQCGVELAYVNIDLYVVQGETTYVTYLATNVTAPAAGIGSIPIKIGDNMRTGSSFVLKVWGPRKDGNGTYEVPNSDHFAIIDPSAGEWNNPGLSLKGGTQFFTGRQATLNYTLGSAFDGVKSIRIDLLSAEWKDIYTIADGIPASGHADTYTLVWHIPASLRLSQFYHLRITASAATLVKKNAVNAPVDDNGAMLSSPEFAIFPHTAVMHPAMTINAPTKWVTNSTVVITWAFQPSPLANVGQWNIELYNTALGTGRSLGVCLGILPNQGYGGQFSYVVPQDLPSGIYFLRLWGWGTTQQASDNVDPVSGTSALIYVTDQATASAYTLSVNAPAQWPQTKNVSISWNYKSDLLNVSGWNIDLFRDSVVYKLYKGLTTSSLPANATNYGLVVPSDWLLGHDYVVRVYGLVQTGNQTQEIGAFSAIFSVVEPNGSQTTTRKGIPAGPTASSGMLANAGGRTVDVDKNMALTTAAALVGMGLVVVLAL
ncbi:uncharacterized protein SPPG_05880 [Spizellomyces punctatus DAOM BR117]|uniref:Uncharacterized protein n=1 Tax=Spizellomyces punctatus (strain DAOM BR117) TaxID=645134 RepID=A0A0L0HCK4_SPIPD|nr:uncharacterized protein SPPG_05880 [Spizellomyces punctatus DAOM BR117]KNC98917.1 hypothetical protein SPPG_05880 [Spizellomyces punctatus DAOM BR117]|eukprot:XP_016606957.1 hypothetical protein SPPG_05880 [Spizellomyces punctatus DAOM BR117]